MYSNMMDTIGFVKNADPEIGQAMEKELFRQRRNLELIASENIVSPAVMAAVKRLMLLKKSPVSVHASCLEQNMPMCSLTPELRQIRLPMQH